MGFVTLLVIVGLFFLGWFWLSRSLRELVREELDQALERRFPTSAKGGSGLVASPSGSSSALEDEVSAETIAVLSAVVAAFLGKKARIKAVRRIPITGAWAEQGRIAIHNSRNLVQQRGF